MARSKTVAKTVGEELLSATGIGKKRPRESMADYQKRLFQACDDLTDDKFDSLSTQAQTYINVGIIISSLSTDAAEVTIEGKPYKNGEDVTFLGQEYEWGEELDFEGKKYEWGSLIDIPGLEAASEQKLFKSKEDKPAKEEQEEVFAEKRGRGRPAGVSNKPKGNGEARSTKASGERKPREINRSGGVYKIKEMVLKDFKADNNAIREKLAKEDVNVSLSTVQGIRSDFLHSLRVLQDKGKLTDLSLD